MSTRHFARFVPLIALTALLAGCAPATVAPTSSPEASSSTTPTPTPTATIAAAAAPGPRVQVKCADLYSVDAVAKLIEATPTIADDETTKPVFLDDAANAQFGTLRCQWEGPDGTEVSAAEDLAISIAPDSAAAYATHSAENLKPGKSAKLFTSTAGDESGMLCRSYGAIESWCDAQMLVGTYWVTVNLSAANASGGPNPTMSGVADETRGVLSNVAGQLAAAPQPLAEWVAPAQTPPSFCGDASTAKVRTIFGVSGYALAASSSPDIDADTVATIGRTASCTWNDSKKRAGSLNVELLASGSWVYPGFTTTPYADGEVRKFSSVQIPGTSGADLGCAGGACESTFAVGTTLVNVNFADLGSAKDKAALTAFAAAIAAS
jgi:hypothetical protein